MLRAYNPFNDVALPDNTVAFVLAKVSIPVSIAGDPVLLEGICVVTIIVGPGSVSAPAKTLPDGTSARHLRLFPRTMYVIRG